jgi:uncharacterized protein YbjQ (UPF0145 family)
MNCKQCNAKIGGGIFKSNCILFQSEIDLINFYHDTHSETYCTSCGEELKNLYSKKLIDERATIKKLFEENISGIPVVSINSPLGWEYETISIATAQSTTGTGVISDFMSDFTDFFGVQSGSYNEKIKKGENICLTQLRQQALHLGGNAVIATDVDYAEVGGGKGMLMVCMTGTAIKLKNIEILNDKGKCLKNLMEAKRKMIEISPLSEI